MPHLALSRSPIIEKSILSKVKEGAGIVQVVKGTGSLKIFRSEWRFWVWRDAASGAARNTTHMAKGSPHPEDSQHHPRRRRSDAEHLNPDAQGNAGELNDLDNYDSDNDRRQLDAASRSRRRRRKAAEQVDVAERRRRIVRLSIRVIISLCIGGLLIAYNGLTFDPASMFVDNGPVPRYIFSFGDSFTTTGFDVEANEYPSVFNPLGNPPFPGVTTSGGPNWVGFMAAEMSPDATMFYNFARNGATINSDIVQPHIPDAFDLRHQVNQFIKYLTPGPQFAPWRGANAAFVTWMGANDLSLSHALDTVGLRKGGSGTFTPLVTGLMRQIDAQQIAGARKFVVLTVPPFQLNPKFQLGDEATVGLVEKDIKTFNNMLKKRIEKWTENHPGATLRVIDTEDVFKQVLNNPGEYNATDATCTAPRGMRCLWTDQFHPGQAIQKEIAKKIYETLEDIGFWEREPPVPGPPPKQTSEATAEPTSEPEAKDPPTQRFRGATKGQP